MKTLNWLGLIALCIRDQNTILLNRIEAFAGCMSFDDPDYQCAVFMGILESLGISV